MSPTNWRKDEVLATAVSQGTLGVVPLPGFRRVVFAVAMAPVCGTELCTCFHALFDVGLVMMLVMRLVMLMLC